MCRWGLVMGTFKTNLFRTVAVCSLINLFALCAVADTWMWPRPFQRQSNNGKFSVVVVPAEMKKPQRPTLEVFKLQNGAAIPQWRVQLSNPVSPLEVLISDDGLYAVTLDNHAQAGYGEDVVAIYRKAGQVKQYPLETIV